MTEEQENFYRHCTVIVDVIKCLFLQLIEFYLKLHHFTTFVDFIRKYQHEIYHLRYMYRCCNCPAIYRQGSNVLSHQQMALLLDTSGPKLPCHSPNSKSSPHCCCQVKAGITVQLLDISLARTLLVNYLVPQCAQERKAIDDLVNIRNNSYGHITSGRMSNDEFKQSIETITNSLMILARLCNKETETKQMLSDALRQPLNPAVCTQLQNTLLQQIQREDKICKELKEIKNTLEDQKSSKDVDISDTFVSLLGKREVYEGQDVQFECKVITSKLQGKWYKDGDPICDSQNVHITQKGRELCLNIYGTGLQDKGEYSCVVNDRETKAFLDVRAYFTITLRDKSCYEGDTITFTCEVIDLLTTAQWRKNGANIDNSRYVIKPMGKTHQLTIEYANLCDSGCFDVDVNGRCRQASLEVKACFITDIKSISCIEGQNVSFTCVIDPGDAVIQWFHGSTEIKSSEKYLLQCDNKKKSLEIRNVDIGDSGEITIRVKNCSRACKLDVRKCFLKELESITTREGYNVQFACEVSYQEVIGTWCKDDEKIENSEKFVIQRSGKKNSLVVYNTSLDDNGTYSFKVHSKVTKASLDVEGYFRKNPMNVTCKEGEVVHITCEAIETSIPAQWCKDRMDIDFNNGKFSKQQNRNEYQLTIRSANQKDSGYYSVNVNGRIRRAYVTVREYFTKPLKDIDCTEGDNISFSCKSIEPTSLAEWSKNKEVIKFGRCIIEHKHLAHRLMIKNVKPSDCGQYCINVSGRISSASLNVKDYFTMRLNDITCKEGETALFKCEAKENGIIVKWYKDNDEIQSDRYIVEQKRNVYQLTIRNVDTVDTGYYTISVNGRTRRAFLMVDGHSENEETLPSRLKVENNLHGANKYVSKDYLSSLKCVTSTTCAIEEGDVCILFSLKGFLYSPSSLMEIIDIDNADEKLDMIIISNTEGQVRTKVVSVIVKDTAFEFAKCIKNLKDGCQVGKFEGVFQLPESEEQAIQIFDLFNPFNTQQKRKFKTERNNRENVNKETADSQKSEEMKVVNIDEQYGLSKIKKCDRTFQEIIIPKNTKNTNLNITDTYFEKPLPEKTKTNVQSHGIFPTKMKNGKVKTQTKHQEGKKKIRFGEDNIRNLVYGMLRHDVDRRYKASFERPYVPWPSMHPLLPYKPIFRRWRDFNTQQQDNHSSATEQGDSCEESECGSLEISDENHLNITSSDENDSDCDQSN
ncbi:OBSCN [Mytilus coruscus]|uniref:OBSCN n=1 Tax=Mytilus coruscus TaxID=42192 RepID=A0A6J8AWL0_MYTCO|nr:OBSCN [Mytilus coruscus]